MGESTSPAVPESDRQTYERSIWFSRTCLRWVLAPFLGFLALTSIATVIAMALEVPRYAIFASVPAGFLLMLWVALRLSSGHNPPDDPSTEERRPIPWRLLDRSSFHWEVWRADLGRLPPEVEGFRNHREVKAYIRKLVRDWSQKSARSGRVVRISRPISPALSPFQDGFLRGKLYRVTLDDGYQRQTGCMRIGANWVEFHIEPSESERATGLAFSSSAHVWSIGHTRVTDSIRRVFQRRPDPSDPIAESTVIPDPASAHHPMWDRWLDA
jgi:hypothetical protein